MSQSRNTISRELVSMINQILTNLVSYKKLRVGYETNPNYSLASRELTKERLSNIADIQNFLSNLVNGIRLDITKDGSIKILTAIEDALITCLKKNNQISFKHGYIHKTYEENRLAGYGILSSWWNKTWTQSEASLALEKSIQEIKEFIVRYSDKKEVQVNPTHSMS